MKTPPCPENSGEGGVWGGSPYRIFFSLLLGLIFLSATESVAQLTGYEYRKQITIQSSQVLGSQSNFPVLISITDADLQANVENANGFDIVFASDPQGANILNHQIERYTASSGNLVAWIQVPALSGSSNTPIYMFYGNPNVATNPSTSATWDGNYQLVQHLHNSFLDGTSNSNDAANNGSTNIVGQIADGQNFTPGGFFGSNDFIQIADDPTLDIINQITISAWIFVDDFSNVPDLVTKGEFDQSYSTWIRGNGTLRFATNGNSLTSSGTVSTGTWQYLTFTKTGNGRQIYINGSLDNSDTNTTAFGTNNAPLFLVTDDFPYDGRLDEVRISNTARSAGWIQTEYNNQNNPGSFYTVSPQELASQNGVAVEKTVDNANPEEEETITYTITAVNDGSQPLTGVQIEDTLPQGLEFISANTSQGSYNAGSGIWNVDNLAVSANATLTIQAQVQFGQEGNTITNTASLTALDQTDENPDNDSDSASLSVQFSGGGPPPANCNDLPFLIFRNGTLASGSAGQLGAVYRFNNVLTGTDATVTITNINNAILVNPDQIASGGSDEAFQPQIEAQNKNLAEGFIDFRIDFFEAGTNNPQIIDRFSVSALDVDGDNQDTREFVGFQAGESYTIEAVSNLDVGFATPFNTFEARTSDVRNGINPNDTENIVYLRYKNISSFRFRGGLMDPTNTSGTSAQRLFSYDFNPCLINNFNNPTTTTVNADVGITKTVDDATPTEGQTIEYTLDVQNNGPQMATGLVVRDPLQEGVTFVSSAATQGSYNAATGMWNIGTLNNGGTVSLSIIATVDEGTIGTSINNIARVDRLNQNDPNGANQIDNASIEVSPKISGTVFEDIVGDALEDGDNVFNDASGDQQGVEDVRVALFQDQGDQVPGGDDTLVEVVQTDANGQYEFSQPAGIYWLVVDSRSGGLSNGTTWPEQTYAGQFAFCEDGTGNTLGPRSAVGPCYGGRRGDTSDNLPSTLGNGSAPFAQHLFRIELNNSDITNIDAGFSYNVVTDTRDGDDDGNANRSIQGSLRQFIQNANAIGGANAMRFVPSVPLNQGNWWSISIASALPAITGGSTAIDGTAYNLADGVTVRNTNAGTTGNSGASIGVGSDGMAGTGDEPNLPDYELAELEINANDIGRIFQVAANNTVVRRLALYNADSSPGFTVSGGTNSNISENLIGVRADGADPGDGLRLNRGVNFGAGESDVTNNRVAYLLNTGIAINTSGTVSGNDLFNIGINTGVADGITVENSASQDLVIENNRIEQVAAYAVESFQAPGPFMVQNNTILNTGRQAGQGENGGIRIFGDGSTIRYNIITGSAGPGLVVVQRTNSGQASTGNLISKNSTYSNGEIGIDLDQTTTAGNPNGDGLTPNNGATNPSLQNIGIDYPVFTEVALEGNTLHVEGYVGTASSAIAGTHTIELFEVADDGNNNGEIEQGDGLNVPHGEGRTFLGDFTTNSDGTFAADLSLPNGSGLAIGDFITATTTNPDNNTSEFSANSEIKQLGVSVSGTVFSDANHNGTQGSGEDDIEGVTVVLHDVDAGTCQSIATDANGDYQFDVVTNGDYQIIESATETIPSPTSCPPAEEDPDGFVSTTGNTLEITVTGTPVTEQNFGDFNGSRLTGVVFSDDGAGGGTANDGLQNGEEAGIAQSTVQLTDDTGSTVIEQTQTNGEGSYTFFIPDALSGSLLRVVETNFDNYVSTGGNAGNTSGSYDRGTDVTTFTPASGTEYTGVNFGDVPDNSFNTDGQQNITAGSTVFFPHTFVARTAGQVSFSTTNTANPENSGWKQTIYRDNNCNGEIDSNDQILSATNTVSSTAGQEICIIVRASTPGGVPQGSSNTISVTADFDYTNTSPALSRSYTRTDLVNITDASGSGLKITKEVDQSQALPGETLTYTITYSNNGSEPLNNLEIIDSTPSFTVFSAASCGEPLPQNLSGCTINAPVTGQEGTVVWIFQGSLTPGSSGAVTYQVTIQN